MGTGSHQSHVVRLGGGVAAAPRTRVCTAASNLSGDTELQGPRGAAHSVACKENTSGKKDQGLLSPFSRSLFIM